MNFLYFNLFFALLVNSHEEMSKSVGTFDVKFKEIKVLNFGPDFRLKIDSNNDLCNLQLKYFQESLNKNILWARKMRDAWGNVPSGRFSGNIFDFGNFDQCLSFQHLSENFGKIVGQHCSLIIPAERVEQTQMARINTFSKS